MDNHDHDEEPPPPFKPQQSTKDRSGSVSLGVPPPSDDAPPTNGDATPSTQSALKADPYAEKVQSVITSDIGVQTLLNRLKQSIASAKEFALFLKKRSTLEEEHANGLRKISRITHENLRRPEHRQGSFSSSYDEISRIHEAMANNGLQFSHSLHEMHEGLLEMASQIERGRKHWKQTGLSAEHRLVEAESAMRKSKAKYDSIADEYDKARTGDRQSGKLFGLKGPKLEEDLLRKVQAADGDYGSKVQIAQTTRGELLNKGRPEAVKSLQELIRECDSALTLQMQKFATFNEKLLLHNGVIISPLNGHAGDSAKESRSLKDAVTSIDNDKDLSFYIASHASSVPPKPAEIRYERNPVLNPTMPTQMQPPQAQRQSDPIQNQSFNSRQGQLPSFGGPPPQASPGASHDPLGQQPYRQGPPPAAQVSPYGAPQHERSFSQGPPPQFQQQNASPINNRTGPPPTQYSSPSGPPQLSALPFQNSSTPSTSFQNDPAFASQTELRQRRQGPPSTQQPPAQSYQQQAPAPAPALAPISYQPPAKATGVGAAPGNLPPLKPVFGMTLEQLFERDGSAVPMVVYQCIQAVDLYGLEVEGIYRLSGTASHVTKIKAMFDHDAAKVDFRNPETFFHDVNSVAGVLKQFFRELPDPLLTTENYAGFIDAAKHDDDIVRRDSLHAIINALPDPNYATLRALTLHLNRVTESSGTNRMNASNLAIVFGPTLMGANTGPNIQDAGWQVRVIDTILQNTYQIFDDD